MLHNQNHIFTFSDYINQGCYCSIDSDLNPRGLCGHCLAWGHTKYDVKKLKAEYKKWIKNIDQLNPADGLTHNDPFIRKYWETKLKGEKV